MTAASFIGGVPSLGSTPDVRVAFLLSGQGSQYRQMGRALFDADDTFRHSMQTLDEVVRREAGFSVLPLLYGEGQRKDMAFQRTLETHPAIFMIEVSLARSLMAQGIMPDLMLASSLGEFAAAAIAEAVEADDMLACVVRSAQAVEAACPPGAMLAVLGDPSLVSAEPDLTVAGISGTQHFVLSGPVAAIEAVQARLAATHTPTSRLPVSHAFHSPHMDLCAQAVRAAFSGISWRQPRVPVFSCLTGAAIDAFSDEHFTAVARHPIRLRDAATALSAQGGPLHLVDIGPAGSLASLVRQAVGDRSDWHSHAALSPFSDDLGPWRKLRNLKRRHPMAQPLEASAAPRKACIFPGQGAQMKGMGAELFPLFPDLVRQANETLGYALDTLCLHDAEGKLRDTRYTQPALYVVNALAYLKHRRDGGVVPDMAAGHSLGEINALFAAEAVDFLGGLRLVQKRAELMAGAPRGGMAAIIGLEPDAIARILKDNGFDRVDVANRNSPSQTVISGDLAQVEAAEAAFCKAGCKAFVKLPVSGAFHSRLMAEAELEFRRFLDQVDFNTPAFPVISNVTARPYQGDATALRDLLGSLITRPVDWLGCVHTMLDQGIDDFVELGPKPVLTAMVRDIRAAWTPGSKDTPAAEPAPHPAPPLIRPAITPESLGSAEFRAAHNLRYAYVCGGMVHGISSVDLVLRCARAGILSFFGSGAVKIGQLESAIRRIQAEAPPGAPWGCNLLNGSNEQANVELFLRHGVRTIEAAAYIKASPALALYRLRGLERDGTGVIARNRVVAKLSRPEVAREFLQPTPEKLVRKLLDDGLITTEQAELARRIPLADDICVEADSGGHTDQGVLSVLLPAIRRLRDAAQAEYGYATRVRVGAGGGIGTPEAAMSALILGADFLVTGSINQCTPEAGTSSLVKDMLQEAEVQDTAYAPAGDMFELGARVQVLRRGVFFPARANRLFELYSQHDGLDKLDARIREQVEQKYFRRSFDDVWRDCLAYYPPEAIAQAERSPKQRMAFVFRWYFGLSSRLALQGVAERKVDFQIHCGPALGAFNQWVQESRFARWQERHVDAIALHLLDGTARALGDALAPYLSAHNR